MTDLPEMVQLDSRRRVYLGKLGNPDHRYYLAHADPDGTITLTPAVVIPATDLPTTEDA